MESGTELFNQIVSQDLTGWLITFLIATVTVIVVKLYLERRSLPPGPFPLPILGNILSFLGATPPLKVIEQYYKTFGSVVTVWLGSKPHIFVNNWDLMKDALLVNKNDFSGRPVSHGFDAMLNGDPDIVFTDSSPKQSILRKIGANAVRKYITTPAFVEVSYDNALGLVSVLLDSKEPIDPADPLYHMMCTLMTTIAFGEAGQSKEAINTHAFQGAIKCFETNLGNGFPTDYFPFLRLFFLKRERVIFKAFQKCLNIIEGKIKEHEKTFKKDDIRDFIDAALHGKAEAEEKEQLTTDVSLKVLITNLFLASVSTTQQTLSWNILQLANSPELQNRVYNEIKDNIGDRMATPDDKDKCPLTSAVISETLRIRTPVPTNLPHKATRDTKIGEHKIPAGMTVFFHLQEIHKSKDPWTNPDLFDPNRFLDENGQYSTARLTHYAPFSLGNRSCIGEKMARLDIFIILVTILQKCEIHLETGPGTADFTPENVLVLAFPKPFKIVCKPRKGN